MKKKKTYTVTQLNKMMMRDDISLWEIIEACTFIDICDCYEPTRRSAISGERVRREFPAAAPSPPKSRLSAAESPPAAAQAPPRRAPPT